MAGLSSDVSTAQDSRNSPGRPPRAGTHPTMGSLRLRFVRSARPPRRPDLPELRGCQRSGRNSSSWSDFHEFSSARSSSASSPAPKISSAPDRVATRILKIYGAFPGISVIVPGVRLETIVRYLFGSSRPDLASVTPGLQSLLGARDHLVSRADSALGVGRSYEKQQTAEENQFSHSYHLTQKVLEARS